MQNAYLARLVEPALARALSVFRVAVVTGARQTGKSTLVRQPEVAAGRTYVTLDDFLLRDQARTDPELLLDRAERLILDEVQHAPDLLIAVKHRVDERNERGQYVLTGSSNLLLQKNVSESLAGRAGYLTLWPLTRREQLGWGCAGVWDVLLSEPFVRWKPLLLDSSAPPEDWRALARRGGYPAPALELGEDSRPQWFEAYAATYLERDLRALSAVEGLADMRRLMTALCLRVGGLLNQAEIARDLAIPTTTIQRYANLLEVSYQLVRLPAYSVNRTKRLIKAPKVYWSDVGLALHLAGGVEPTGAHLENIVLTDLLAWSGAAVRRASLLHWRTVGGAEVDLIVELPGRLLPIEVKTARRVGASEARHLITFLDEYEDRCDGALLLYDGDETFEVAPRVIAAPWWRVI